MSCDCNEPIKYVIIFCEKWQKCYECKEKLPTNKIMYSCEKYSNHILCKSVYNYDKYVLIHGFNNHNGCGNCGSRNIINYDCLLVPIDEYDEKKPDEYLQKIEHCKCGEICKYATKLESDILCSMCDNIIYKKNYKLNLCSSKCHNAGWYAGKYISGKKNDITFRRSFFKNKNVCLKCGDIRNFEGDFFGSLMWKKK